MPKFSQESFSKLSTCHMDLQVLFYEVVKTIDCEIVQGHRQEKEQEEAFERGITTLHWPDGKHNALPSHSVDVCFIFDGDNNIHRFYWFAGFVIATAKYLKEAGKITHEVKWGGNVHNNEPFYDLKDCRDLLHFELVS